MGTPHERADVIARVYARWCEIEAAGLVPTQRGLGREFGLTPWTIRRYVEIGKHAEQWQVVYDRQAMASIVQDALSELLEDALADSQTAKDGKERAAHRMTVLATIREIKSLHGLNAPVRVQVSGNGDARPDPDLLVAVSGEIRALNEEKRRRALDPARDEED